MSAPLQDITNTAAALEECYTRQVEVASLDYMHHNDYFMDLENHTLSGVSNDIQNLAMNARNERHLIPEWYQAIQNNIDYNQGAGPTGLSANMAKYCQWVTAGMGDEWFVETDTEDEDYSHIDIEMYDENYTQRDEDIMEYNDEIYSQIFD